MLDIKTYPQANYAYERSPVMFTPD